MVGDVLRGLSPSLAAILVGSGWLETFYAVYRTRWLGFWLVLVGWRRFVRFIALVGWDSGWGEVFYVIFHIRGLGLGAIEPFYMIFSIYAVTWAINFFIYAIFHI
ncbi:hypothetical protein [Cohnella fermenti]|uniref:Uncharacterized protein n=1 Tax=Cohnella fermenti TaxID=2565925 RepID=A0A4S4BKT8_9BACL|nr:hypothetical protein [Cohnella fermenti]THF74746.1 hypothetical protein E6C55_24365 [Cohnella fermenti]